ncbi:ABC transporter substrate-binding protein [Paenibacillus sp. GYB003]|uniref:ABC transporter substrate-binding protein n=1 Tax=Paenibacillus sp. GYB003 TaxID=2994392 RepID=UPI002F96694A
MAATKSVLLAAIAAAAMLSACSQGGSGGETPKAADGQPPKTAEPVQLTIVTNAGHTEEAFNTRFGDSIRKKFPNYTIKFIPNSAVKFADLVATKTEVDIVYAAINDFTNGPLKNGMVYDMTELMKKHGVDPNRVGMNWVEGLSPVWDGKLYGLPISVETLTLFYNKDLFDRFGVAYPRDKMTWDDVFDLNNKLTRVDQGVQYVGLAVGESQHFALNALSLPYFNAQTGKPTLSQEEAKWKTVYETIAVRPLAAQGYKDKVVSLKNKIPGDANFTKSRDAAMLAGLVHAPLSYLEMKEMNWDMVSYPTYSQAPGTSAQANLLLFGVTNMSRHKDQAMEVIQYLYSDEFQTITARDGNVPVVVNDQRKKEFAQNTYYKDRNVQSVFINKLAPLSKRTIYDPDLSALYRKYLGDLAVGNIDLNSMLRKVEEEAIQTVAALKSR